MENPVTHYEQTEFEKLIRAEIGREHDENNRQNKRLEDLEEETKRNGALLTSVEKLAVSMENMQKEQNRQGERLDALESRDGEMWRKVVSYAVTAVLGAVIAFILAQVGIG